MSPNLCGPHLLEWPAASETTVKRSALSDYRGVYFAMHDLVADEIKGLAELLTLPKEPTDNDDSLLTASEVAQLKSNPRGGALSGLTHAFFAVASIGSS